MRLPVKRLLCSLDAPRWQAVLVHGALAGAVITVEMLLILAIG